MQGTEVYTRLNQGMWLADALTEQPKRANDTFVEALEHGRQPLAEEGPGR